MRIRVEATNVEGGFTSALSINGKVMDPAGNQQDVRLVGMSSARELDGAIEQCPSLLARLGLLHPRG